MKCLESFESLIFEIPGEPMPMPRARHSNAGGFVRTYTPEKAVAHKGLIQHYWREAAKGFAVPLDAIVSIGITVVKQLPKSAPRWLKVIVAECELMSEWGSLPPAVPSRGDTDNYFKIVADALQGLAYRNDSQVYDGRCTKVWGGTARTVVEVTYWRYEEVRA